MNKELKNLPSEQLLNDGGYHWNKLINDTNTRLGKIGKHGKRAKIKGYPKPGQAIIIQFSFRDEHPNPQKSVGVGLNLDKNNLVKAEEICSIITGQLVAGTFSWDWFYSLVGKPEKITKPEKVLSCGEMLEQYKAHYFKQRKDDKNPGGNWFRDYGRIEKTFLKYKNNVVDLKIVKEAIDHTKNNTLMRTRHLNGLANLLKHFDNNEFKQLVKRYKLENNPKPKDKYIPTDTKIDYVYQTGFEVKPRCPKKSRYRYAQWQFLYSLLAIYGLRVHEAWNIKNWDKAVTLKAGEWIAVDDETENINDENEDGKYSYHQIEQDQVIPAILDPNNEDYLLCIGHETKTGYRVAFPMSPSGIGKECDWIEKFNVAQPMNLPDIKNPLDWYGKGCAKKCSTATAHWFTPQISKNGQRIYKSRYGFTAHALRHAYNIRGHKLGINQKALAQGLGHGLQMNSNNYMRHEQTSSKIQGIRQEVIKQNKKKTETQELRDENKYLRDENKFLKTENEKLKTKLAMYEAIDESKKSN